MKQEFILLFTLMLCKLSLHQKVHNGSPLDLDEVRMVKTIYISSEFDFL